MNVTRSVLEDIKTKQLQWYGHVQRMEEGETTKKKYWNGGHQGEENEVDLNYLIHNLSKKTHASMHHLQEISLLYQSYMQSISTHT